MPIFQTLRRLVATLAVIACAIPMQAAAADVDPWPEIRKLAFGDREISESGSKFALYAPAQAADAALVPLAIHLPEPIANTAKSLTFIIDRNPAPVAAKFEFGDAYRTLPVGERVLSTRVRVDAFSKVRAILETTDGQLFMVAKFVAGAGGCSAVASKDPEEAIASLGKVQVKSATSGVHSTAWRDAVVMIRHPNFTGMQMDTKRGQFTPARFVDRLEVKAGGKVLFVMNGGISISENPNLRFTYGAKDGERLSIDASDTEKATFAGTEADSGS